MKKNKLRTVISYLFTFFIAFFLFMIAILTTSRFTIMSPTYFMNVLESTDYYKSTAVELNRMIKQNAAPSGFPIAMFDSYIEDEDIHEDMYGYIENMLDGEPAAISVKQFEDRLKRDTNTYIAEQNIIVNPSIQVGIDEFIQTVVDKYTYLTQFPYLDMYGKVIHTFEKIYLIAIPILLGIVLLLGALIYRMYSSRRYRKRYYAYAFIGAGLLTSVLPICLLALRFVEKINLNPEYMYNLLVTLLKNYLIANIFIGCTFIVVGIVIAYIKLKKKKSKKGKRNSRIYPDLELFVDLQNENE